MPLMIAVIEDEDDKAFMTWVYLQYRRLIYSEIQKITGDDVEDLLQLVIEKLIDKLSLLREMERGKLVNYIVSTAKNTAYSSFRDKRQEALWEDQEQLPDPGPLPEEAVITQEAIAGLARVWNGLDERTRYLLSAKYILNKTGREIADDLKMPPDHVRMALVRAKKKARRAMGQSV